MVKTPAVTITACLGHFPANFVTEYQPLPSPLALLGPLKIVTPSPVEFGMSGHATGVCVPSILVLEGQFCEELF